MEETSNPTIEVIEKEPEIKEEVVIEAKSEYSTALAIVELKKELARVNNQLAEYSNTKTKKKIEKSTILCVVCIIAGIGCIVAYYVAIFMGLDCDSSVATTALTVLIGSVLSYCLYNFGLKNSRNKYGVDENGQPYKEKFSYEDDDDDVETVSSEGAVG